LETAGIAEFLFRNGFVDVDHKNVYRITPLTAATKTSSKKIVEYVSWLLDWGADPLASGRLMTIRCHITLP
jgi:hypothetical protein